MGLNALPMYRVKFDGVKVPNANRIGGEVGLDFGRVLASMRVANAAAAIGVAKAAFEYSRDYAKDREAFGVKIAQKQAIAFMLAEMLTEIEAIRMLTWQAAWKLDTDKEDAFDRCLPRVHRSSRHGDDGHRPRSADPRRAWIYS